MIWNSEDIEDIAKNKFSIQSSIGKYSIQNANVNLLKDDFPIGEYAFHTAKEDNPWCIIDLEHSYPIEHIRVYNIGDVKYRERTKSLYAEVSHNGIDWIKVSSELCSWEDDYFIFNAVLSQVYSARYIKLSLSERNYFHLSKVQVFTRKIPGYIISAKPDGFGMKLYSILAGMFLAEKTGMKFKFTWFTPADFFNNPNQCLGISFGGIDEVFSSEFISQYYISNSLVEKNHGFFIHSKKRTIKEILNGPYEKTWGWNAPGIEGGLLSEWVEDIDQNECIVELKRIYDAIMFSDKFEYIRKKSMNDALEYGDFVALHIRGADIVYSEHYRRFSLYGFVGDKFFPYEIAIELALREIKKNNKIIIFGQDIVMNNNLVQYILKVTGKKNIITIDSFLEEYRLNDFERSFYEMNFMSKAKIIYRPGISKQKSAFSYCSMIISGRNNAISFHEVYSKEEQFDIISKRIQEIDANNRYRSFSYLRLFLLSRELGFREEKSIEYAQKAYECDPENESFVILIIKMFFLRKEYNSIEKYLREVLIRNENRFFKTLFIHQAKVYKNELLEYERKASLSYPYISYVAAKISLFQKNPSNALKFIQYSLKSQPDNKEFLSCKKEIEALLPKEEITKAEVKKTPPKPEPTPQELEINSLKASLDSTKKQLESKNKILESMNKTLESKTKEMDFTLHYGTAKNRIHNHLSYKLGKAMIENSKSILGYIRMPYVLSYIKEQHNKEQKQYQEQIKKNPNLKLPKLESYKDYKEALKEKECFTYKLGEAFIRANTLKSKNNINNNTNNISGGGGADIIKTTLSLYPTIYSLQTHCLLQVCKRSA